MTTLLQHDAAPARRRPIVEEGAMDRRNL